MSLKEKYGNGMAVLRLFLSNPGRFDYRELYERLLQELWDMLRILAKYPNENVPEAIEIVNELIASVQTSELKQPKIFERFRPVSDTKDAAALYYQIKESVEADLRSPHYVW